MLKVFKARAGGNGSGRSRSGRGKAAVTFAARLTVDGVSRRYAQLARGTSPYAEWASRLVTLGQHVTAHLGDGEDGSRDATPRILSGVAQGVDGDGALLLRAPDGTVHRLLAADISLRPSI